MRLRERLARHDLTTAALRGAGSSVPLAALARSGLPEDLRGRSVLLITRDQVPSACALVALDGLAARILVCPPDVAPAHLGALVADAAVDRVVCDAASADVLRAVDLPRLVLGGDLAAWPPPARGALDSEWVLLTSGTTGAPKLVAHRLDALTGAIPAGPAPGIWATFYDVRRYGGLQILLRALVGGGTLVLSQAAEPLARHIERLGAAGVTHVSGTPSHWRRVLMSEAAPRMAPRSIRLSGEIADQPVLDALAARYPGAVVAHAFASTEAGVAFTVDDGQAGLPPDLIAHAHDGVEMRILAGTLCIRSARTADHYLSAGAPPLRAADGFVDTGDMLERRGARYHFIGRRGGIINVGGQTVHPEEVEAAINGAAGVRMSRVGARPNAITGALVTADVWPRDPAALAAGAAADALRAGIVARCRALLPAYKVPARIRFVAALDILPTGKLARRDA